MNFDTINRRLVMRYASPEKAAFSFAQVNPDASDAGLMQLANAFADIQAERPSRISTIVTRRLV